MLSPASLEARSTGHIWWFYFGVAVAVYAVVMAVLLAAIGRARRQREHDPRSPAIVVLPSPETERRLRTTVSVAVSLTVALLLALLVSDYALAGAGVGAAQPDALRIKITGRQWWWRVEYEDPDPSKTFETANEFHLPVGRTVQVTLQSADVIHSFWLPNLQGKRDLVPGRVTSVTLHPDRLGRFAGQCAEFCGLQHAHMRLAATVETAAAFAQWQEAQRRPAPEPATESEKHGREIFLHSSCVMCHAINGTPAGSRVGPPLTHFASQATIAAGSWPNNRGYLAGWILDPQALKPGTLMPGNAFSHDDLQALLDYLQGLK